MGCSQSLDTQPAIFFNGGGDRGNESRVHVFFAVEMALVIGGFSVFNLFDDGVNCYFLERLSHIQGFFNFQMVFTDSGQVGNEVPNECHSTGC
jgi:hypothetical protein